MGKKSRKKQAPPKTHAAPKPAGRMAAHRPVFEGILFGLALLGVLVTAHMNIWWAFYDAAASGAAGSECGLPGVAGATSSFDCAAAFTSDMGTLFGVPNAVWGLLFFLAVAGVTVAGALGPEGRRTQLKMARAGLLGAGFLYALFLTAYQFFVLPKACLLCLFSASVVALLFAVQALYLYQGAGKDAGRPVIAAPLKLYGGLAVLLLVLLAADFAYFNGQEPAPTAAEPAAHDHDVDVAASCRFDEEKPVFANFDMLVGDNDAFKGPAEAPVTIIEYFDPNCPHCKTLYPIMKDLAEHFPDQLRIVYKPVAVIGQQSLTQVAALHAAAEAGPEAFFGMLERQFDKQNSQGFSLNEVRDFAEDVGMDDAEMARRIRNGDFRDVMRREAQVFRGLGMTGVPALIIEGRTIAGQSRSIECLTHFVEEQLALDGAADSAPAEVPGAASTGD